MDVLGAFVGEDSWGTALANAATVVGVFAGLGIALHINGNFSASLALTARLLQTTFKLGGGTVIQSKDELPPGDMSRVLYEAYAISRAWTEPYWTGGLAPGKQYEAHVEEALFLLDRVLRHAPSAEARTLWANQISVHVFAHGRLLKGLVWRLLKLRRYSLPMQTLIVRAPNPKAPSKIPAGPVSR